MNIIGRMGSKPRLSGLLQKLFSRRFLTFGAVGFSGIFINLGMLYLFADRLGVPEVMASAGAIEISIVWNFLLNNALTFADKNAGASVGFLARMVRYNLVGLAGLGIQLGVFVLMTRSFQRMFHLEEVGIWKYPAQLVGIVLGMAWNFFTNFFWTWRQRPADKAPIAEGDSA